MSRRRPEVTETRFHPAGCRCGESECVALAIKLDVSAVYARPLPALDPRDPAALLRGEDDGAVAAARKGGA